MWIEKDGILQEESLLKLGIRHFCTIKSCRNMRDEINRRKLFEKLKLNHASLVTAGQIHDNVVYLVGTSEQGQRISGVDGLIAETEGIPLGIFTADCVPLFVAEAKQKKIGLLHIGWRGLAKGIVENGINKFDDIETLIVGIGPHICEKCYTVGEDVMAEFPKSIKGGKLDLTGEIKLRLLALGIQEKNIYAYEGCTYHEQDRFYSYRRGDQDSRILSVMML